METLLSLVNMAREECGASGGALSTVANVSGESLRFKNWIIRTWNEIQELHDDWKWMRSAFSFTTTIDKGAYTSAEAGIVSRFNYWDKTYCTCRITANGVSDQTELTWMEYETFRSVYLTGLQNSNRPQHFTIGLTNELLIGPAPESDSYTISGQYAKSNQVLVVDGDIPEVPEEHGVIAYGAMIKYARYEVAAEVLSDATRQYNRKLRKLESKYLPIMTTACPLL